MFVGPESIDGYGTLRRLENAIQESQQCAFAGSVVSDDEDQLTMPCCEG